MAISGAAVSNSMGRYRTRAADGVIGMLGFGIGRWVGQVYKTPWKYGLRFWLPALVFFVLGVTAIVGILNSSNAEQKATMANTWQAYLSGLYAALNSAISSNRIEPLFPYLPTLCGFLFTMFCTIFNSYVNSRTRLATPLFQWIAEAAYIETDKLFPASLSDGGHSENLAALPLLASKEKCIVICDGGADPEGTFIDLLMLLEVARRVLRCEFYGLRNAADGDAGSTDVRAEQDIGHMTELFRDAFRQWSITDSQMPAGIHNVTTRTMRFKVRYDNGEWIWCMAWC